MIHSTQEHMLDEMMAKPAELFIVSKSKRFGLYYTPEQGLFLNGDFSGTEAECEIEIRRILKAQSSDEPA